MAEADDGASENDASSVSSMARASIIPKGPAVLKLSIKYDGMGFLADTAVRVTSKPNANIEVAIIEGRNLPATLPYIKVYMSKVYVYSMTILVSDFITGGKRLERNQTENRHPTDQQPADQLSVLLQASVTYRRLTSDTSDRNSLPFILQPNLAGLG